MTVKQLDHINLTVTNFKETVDWYGRLFGFEVVEQGVINDHPWGVIRCGEAMLCIFERPDFTNDLPENVHRVNHFGLRITDRNHWEETIDRENVKVEYGGPVRWPHSTAWYIKDPTGYEIEVALWDNDQVRFDPLKEEAVT